MSRLSQLVGKKQTFNIGGVDLEIAPFKLDEMHLLSIDQNAPQEEQMKQTRGIMAHVLKKSVPDATDEEIGQLSVEYMTPIMEAIMKVNGLDQANLPDVGKPKA